MYTDRRYQVFVSSTYEDLREERQQATQAILQLGCFPSGMELFPATDVTQWELIQTVIAEADYYVTILGGRYGSLGPMGLSYTEMEYDFAISNDIPVLGFLKADISEIKSRFVEGTPERREKLSAFRAKVMTRHCRTFQSPEELGSLVMKSLMNEIRVKPRLGWVRANLARTDADRGRESELQRELATAKREIAKLNRKLRDRSLSVERATVDQLASGNEIFTFDVTFNDSEKKLVWRRVDFEWDEIFETIAPSMFGYIVRKASKSPLYGYAQKRPPAYPFQNALVQLIRSKIIDEVQSRQIDIKEGQVDTCVIQFKELGLVEFAENEDGKDTFRGITLTVAGEEKLTRLKVQLKHPNPHPSSARR
ncbi:MAG: DUF4062 domain-containing protein [Hyphomonadaceae bacterium]|nr:DUF4062 domain-containing protein [Hyphomonadaceae bacterium]